MSSIFKKLSIKTVSTMGFIDIIAKVQKFVRKSYFYSGLVQIYIPYTTAAVVTINENADHDVKADMKKEINKIVLYDNNYAHLERNSAAYIKSSLFGADQNIIFENKKSLLGI